MDKPTNDDDLSNPCDKCGKEVISEFTVSNEMWSLVTNNHPGEDGYGDGYWCIPCFMLEAEKHPDNDFTMVVHTRSDYHKSDYSKS